MPHFRPGLPEGATKPFLRRNTEGHDAKKYQRGQGSSGRDGLPSAQRSDLYYPGTQQLHQYGCMDPLPDAYKDLSMKHQYHNQSAALVEIGSDGSYYPSSF